MTREENLGLGVMIRMLSGNRESAAAFAGAVGKTIDALRIDRDKSALLLGFTDGTAVMLADRGQSCCETRYITCDDDLSTFIGAKLVGGEVAEGPTTDLNYGTNECAFLRVHTDRGDIVCTTHNEHNGYYGGFSIEASESTHAHVEAVS